MYPKNEKKRVFDPSLRRQKLYRHSLGGETDSEYAECDSLLYSSDFGSLY